jgi:CHAT domain-containing protein/lipopolysaccharide biosynthesis regulator YciM
MRIFTKYKLLLNFIFLACTLLVKAQNSDYKEWLVNYEKGIELIDSKKYREALPYLETAYEVAQKTITQKDEEYGSTVFELANNYKNLKEYDKAIFMYLKSLNYLKLNNQEGESIYGKRLNQLGVVYRYDGKYEKAEKILIESLEITKNTLGKQSLGYATTLLELSIVYKKTGNFSKAIQTSKESNKIVEKLLGLKSKEYAQNLTFLSQIYSEIGDYDKAIPIQENVLNSYLEEDKKSINYALAIFTMAVLYNNINEYNKEIPLYEEVIQILGKNHAGSIAAYNNIGQVYDHLGDYEKALFFTKKSIDNTSETDPALPTRLQNLAFIYVSMGNYDKALIIYNKALIAREKISGKDHYLYGKLVNNIGKLYEQKGEINEAIVLYKKSLDNLLLNFDENYIDYGYYINDYASALIKKGDFEKGIELLKKNIALFEKNKRTNAEDYYKSKYFLANAYIQTQKYTIALPLLKSASKNIKKILGTDHPLYGKILESLSDCYIGLKNMDKAIATIEKSNIVRVSQINKIFKFRSEQEKKTYLNTLVKDFDHLQSISLGVQSNSNKLTEINLNNQLMLKGLLLNNSKDILVQLASLSDTLIDFKIISYRFLKRELSKQLSLPEEDRTKNIDSIKEVINNTETELVKYYSSKFDDNTHLTKDWKKVQSKLHNDDIAIEFSSFRNSNNQKQIEHIIYVAYVFKKAWQYPKMITLFEETELKNLLEGKTTANDLYNDKKLYSLIWQPLEKEIFSNANIFYSPTGLLNQISFAAINNDITLSDKYNLVQLSSTSVLSDKLSEPKNNNSLFIGNINYDYVVSNNKITDLKENTLADSEILVNTRSTRGESWNDLPGSLKEINEIKSILDSKGYHYTTLTGIEANETNFKKLSGNSPNIIHIATHGFFYENSNNKPLRAMNLSTEDQYRLAEDPLLRSGLILAGANVAWKNGVNLNAKEDGILTAMEISNIDLSNTDMIVLSACETGLGDIDGSEGVYGLQRAFKMAGINIIVMSLWQVPDIETAEFMKLFYNNWLSGEEIRIAFINAQRTMQEKYKNEPLKWAAFVLFE